MTEVEKVALWAGLISSIVGIVLSVVAIVSSILTNINLEKVTNQTLISLQKIESDVARISEETSGLIKAGWERMLGSVTGNGSQVVTANVNSAKEIANGLTNEIRAAFEESKQQGEVGSPDQLPKIEAALREIRTTIAAQMGTTGYRATHSNRVLTLDQRIAKLPDLARELAFQIRNCHLTRKQYEGLRASPLATSVLRLRRTGILVPLGDHGDKSIVYWLPPDDSDSIISALYLSRTQNPETRQIVAEHLKSLGYPEQELQRSVGTNSIS